MEFVVLADGSTTSTQGGEIVVGEIVDLVQSAYRGEASRQGWTTEADILDGQRVDADMVEEILANDDAAILTLRSHGQLVGCCELRRQPHDTVTYLGMLAVLPGLQASGLGRMILEEAERIAARHWSATQMAITVIESRHELIAWYERRGYVRTGETGEFPYGDERFGIPLRDDLRFVSLKRRIVGSD